MTNNGDIKDATKTYESFMGALKWGTIVSFAVAAFVVILIAS